MGYNFQIVPDYKPQTIEQKWQDRWRSERTFEVGEDAGKPKFYCLEMFAYPSGHAHVGHVRNYMIGDVVARMKRMRGFNVLHPFGWDAFGLPAENAAIKNGTHPETWTLENIAHMKGQLQRLGISYAWEREIATCLPDYYRWNQWLFIKMLERDLAFRRRSTVNWCPSCQTVLANEQVVDGKCWRCGSVVETRDLEQWFFRITKYADELLDGIDELPEWPEKVLTMQRNWIGRSEGARVRFPLADAGQETIEVFTTRIDTIYGANFLLLAPEHPLVQQWSREGADPSFPEHLKKFQAQDRTARMTGEVEKEGFPTGRNAINPFTKAMVPIWVANFVLVEYGTGAVMAVPAHDQRDFEFAQKYGLPVTVVVEPGTRTVWRHDRPLRGAGAAGELRRVRRPPVRRCARADDGGGGAAWHRRGNGSVPLEGLGHLAPAVLGHADPGRLLREGRHRAGTLRRAAGGTAEGRGVQRTRGFTAGPDPGVREYDLPGVRRSCHARDRHDGHVRRFVLVLLPVL